MNAGEISQYNDFRKLIRDCIEARRSQGGGHSLIYYSRLIGASDSYLKLIVSGKRSLNIDKARLLAQKLRFKEPALSYFLTLVMRDKATTPALQRYYDSVLLNYRKLSLTYGQTKYSAIFNDVLMWEIFSLVGVDGFRPDPAWIAPKLRKRGVGGDRIRRALLRLEQMGAITIEADHCQAHDIVLKHDKVVNYAYIAAWKRAIEFLGSEGDGGDAHFDAFCLILSEDEYQRVAQLLTETRHKIAELVRRKGPKTLIAFLNLGFFRASR